MYLVVHFPGLYIHPLFIHTPAVDHHGPCIWRVTGLDPSEEGQDRSGVLGHTVVGPGHELELPHLSLLTRTVLQECTVNTWLRDGSTQY